MEQIKKQSKVLICDDHEVVRIGLRSILEKKYNVVGEASDADEAIQLTNETEPDVIIMDIRLPGRNGIEACRDIRSEHPYIHVIMLTSYADDEAIFSSIMAGASGYLLKQTRGVNLTNAIDIVIQGGSLLDPIVTQKVMEKVRGNQSDYHPGSNQFTDLSDRELTILTLISEGLTNKEIANKVYLSDKTVKNYVSNILSKLNVKRRSEAATLFAKRNINDD